MKSVESCNPNGLILPGLDGTNPLGFLAALGLFHIVDTACYPEQVLMQWLHCRGTWVPNLIGVQLDPSKLLDLLKKSLIMPIEKHPISMLSGLGKEDIFRRISLFKQKIQEASFDNRTDADLLSALASDVIPSTVNNQLQTTRRDYHYGNLTSIIRLTTDEHLRRTIFSPWDYGDPLENQSLHLDPSEDRRHAYQWNQPNGDPTRKTCGGMLGANRLAIEAFIWFTSLPDGEALRTVGFTGQSSNNIRWTWPIWDRPLNASTIRTVMTLTELQEREVSSDTRDKLRHRGVAAAFRTARILVGKTPNFTPAQQIA